MQTSNPYLAGIWDRICDIGTEEQRTPEQDHYRILTALAAALATEHLTTFDESPGGSTPTDQDINRVAIGILNHLGHKATIPEMN
jgi:hypothetical protein